MELVEQLLTFENLIDGVFAAAVTERVYQAGVRTICDYREEARELDIEELKDEIHSMHAGI